MTFKEAQLIYLSAINAVKCDTLISRSISLVKDKLTILKYGSCYTPHGLLVNSGNCGQKLETVQYQFDMKGKQVYLIGGGKCVLHMASSLLKMFDSCRSDGSKIKQGCLSIPIHQREEFQEHNVSCLFDRHKVKCMFGAEKNLPDESSINATKSIMGLISSIDAPDPVFIVLISGGGSSCLSLPTTGVSLQQKLDVIKALVLRGADIVELNKVRSAISSVKCGGLARHILEAHQNATIVTLVMSDIIGDPLEFIASGPTYIRHNTVTNVATEAISVLKKYSLIQTIDESTIVAIRRTSERQTSISLDKLKSAPLSSFIIGSNRFAIESAKTTATNMGYNVKCLGEAVDGAARDVASKFVEAAQFFIKNSSEPIENLCVMGGGETTVSYEPDQTWGLGGRCQEMALEYLMRALQEKEIAMNEDLHDTFLAGSTDGQDGPTEFSGCIASATSWNKNNSEEIIKKSLHNHDSTNFWLRHQPDWLLRTGPTGTNVMDIYMLLLKRRYLAST